EAMLAGYYDYKTTAANLLALAPEARRILEVGVGTAIVAAELKQLLPTAEFVGIDHTEAMVEKARVRLGGSGQLRWDDIAHADLGETFDLIFSHGGVWVFLTDYLLTHIYDRRRNQLALKTVSRHLRRDGKLLINIQPMHTAADTTLKNGAH